VTDAGAGRHDAEVLERLLAPLQEAVALAVALVFELDVAGKGGRRAEFVDDDRVVDDEIDRYERIDLFGIASQRNHRVAHGGEVDHGRNTGEVLHQHAGGAIGDLAFNRTLVVQPFGNRQDLRLIDGAAIFMAKQVLEQDLHGKGKLGDAGETVGFRFRKTVIDIVLAVDGKDGATIETVERFGHGKTPLIIEPTRACGRLCTTAHQDAGATISAVRTRRRCPHVRRKMINHAGRWRGCEAYR